MALPPAGSSQYQYIPPSAPLASQSTPTLQDIQSYWDNMLRTNLDDFASDHYPCSGCVDINAQQCLTLQGMVNALHPAVDSPQYIFAMELGDMAFLLKDAFGANGGTPSAQNIQYYDANLKALKATYQDL